MKSSKLRIYDLIVVVLISSKPIIMDLVSLVHKVK